MRHQVVVGRDTDICEPVYSRVGAKSSGFHKVIDSLCVHIVWVLGSGSKIPIKVAIGFSFMFIAIVNDVLPRVFPP